MDKIPNQAFKDDLETFFKNNPEIEKSIELSIFSELFADQLNDSAEFGFSSLSGTNYPDITIEGSGEAFHSSIVTFLKKSCINSENINWYTEINKFFPNVKTLLKSNFSRDKIASISIYYQAPIEPDTLNIILKKRSSIPDISRFWDCMKILERKILFIGLDLPKEGLPSIQPYLLVPPTENISKKLGDCAEIITGKEYCIEKWHNILTSNNDIFVSFSISDILKNRIKIDYEKVPITSAYKVAKDINIDKNIFVKLIEIADSFDIKTLSFLGIKLTESVKLKYYIKRAYYAKNNENELLAKFLERTAGRFLPKIN